MKKLLLIVVLIIVAATPVWAIDAILSYQDNASNEDGFNVYRSLNGAPEALLFQIVGANVITYTDKTLTQDLMVDNTYCYTITAYNTTGESGHSNQACKTITRAVPDGNPSNLTVQ